MQENQMHRTTPSLLHYLDIIGTMGVPRMLWLCSYPPLQVGKNTRDYGPIKQRVDLLWPKPSGCILFPVHLNVVCQCVLGWGGSYIPPCGWLATAFQKTRDVKRFLLKRTTTIPATFSIVDANCKILRKSLGKWGFVQTKNKGWAALFVILVIHSSREISRLRVDLGK